MLTAALLRAVVACSAMLEEEADRLEALAAEHLCELAVCDGGDGDGDA
jgi:hypothetical protein